MSQTLYPPGGLPATPTYDQFRRHAVFSTDFADFVLYESGLKLLLSELELLWGGASLGIGDLSVLMRAAGGQPALSAALAGPAAAAVGPRWGTYKPALTYQAAVHLCRVLCERAARVRNSMVLPTTTRENISPADAGHGPHHTHPGTGPVQEHQLDLNHLLRMASQAVAPPPPINARMPSQRQTPSPAPEHEEQVQNTSNPPDSSSQGHTHTGTHWWDLEVPGRLPVCSMPPSRPQTAQPRLAASPSQLPASQPLPCGVAADGDGPSSLLPEPALQSPARLSVQWNRPAAPQPQDFEPRLLYEAIRLPACEFSNVSRLVTGTKALQNEGQHVLVVAAIREVVANWEQALADKAANGSRKKGKSETASDALADSRSLPGEAAVWALLVTGMSCQALHKYQVAEQLINAAVATFHVHDLGEHHNFNLAVQLCKGVIDYQAGRLEEACNIFKEAYASGITSGRATLDPIILRNAAAAVNNQGVALLQMGDRAGAVRCFGAAVDLLRHVPSKSSTPIVHELAAMAAFGPGKAGGKTGGSPATVESSQPEASNKKGKKKGEGSGPEAIAPPAGLDAPAAQIAMHNLQGSLRHAFGLGAGSGPVNPHSGYPVLLTGNSAARMSPLHPLQLLRASRTMKAQAGQAVTSILPSRPATAPAQSPGAAFADASVTRGRFQAAGTSGCLASALASSYSQQRLGSTLVTQQEPLKSFLSRAITLKPSSPPSGIPPYAQRVNSASVEGAGKGKGKDKGKDGKKDSGGKKGKDGKGSKDSKKKPKMFAITYTSDYYDFPTYNLANVKAEAPKKKGGGKKKAK